MFAFPFSILTALFVFGCLTQVPQDTLEKARAGRARLDFKNAPGP